jgi:hypothetical protein
MKEAKTGFYIVVVVVGFLMLTSCGKQEKKSPQTSEEPQEIQAEDSLSAKKEFVEVDMSTVSSIKKGESFEIKVQNEDQAFQLQVRRVQESIPGITSISANIGDRDTGLATLLLRNGKLSGILDLYKEGKSYKVGYDSTASAHYIQEILPEDRDELEGSAPLVPGRDTLGG